MKARIYYQYHPHANQSFKVLQRASGKTNQITLELKPGQSFTVPNWMIQEQARDLVVGSNIYLPISVYDELIDLLRTSCFAWETFTQALEPSHGSAKL